MNSVLASLLKLKYTCVLVIEKFVRLNHSRAQIRKSLIRLQRSKLFH